MTVVVWRPIPFHPRVRQDGLMEPVRFGTLGAARITSQALLRPAARLFQRGYRPEPHDKPGVIEQVDQPIHDLTPPLTQPAQGQRGR